MQNCVKGSSLTDRRLSASDQTKRNFKKPVHFTNDDHSQKGSEKCNNKTDVFYKKVLKELFAVDKLTHRRAKLSPASR